jgi:hypothetical protein
MATITFKAFTDLGERHQIPWAANDIKCSSQAVIIRIAVTLPLGGGRTLTQHHVIHLPQISNPDIPSALAAPALAAPGVLSPSPMSPEHVRTPQQQQMSLRAGAFSPMTPPGAPSPSLAFVALLPPASSPASTLPYQQQRQHQPKQQFPSLRICRCQDKKCESLHGEMDPEQEKVWARAARTIKHHGQMCLHHYHGNCDKKSMCTYFHLKEKPQLTEKQKDDLRALQQRFGHRHLTTEPPVAIDYSLFSHKV